MSINFRMLRLKLQVAGVIVCYMKIPFVDIHYHRKKCETDSLLNLKAQSYSWRPSRPTEIPETTTGLASDVIGGIALPSKILPAILLQNRWIGREIDRLINKLS